jgi:hypothetical protein
MEVSDLRRDIPGRGVDFVAKLIVLESKGIDVILGMDWLSKHRIPIDMLRNL